LSLARARCDAIVTTGRILREEPELRHSLPADLAAWRRECRGLPKPPVSIVLTARADLDPAHALLCDANRVIVVTSRDVAPVLSERLGSERLEVVGRDAPSLRDTLSFLQRDRGLPSVCIEAGPSSSRDLYETPLRVDELMLSIYIGASVGQGVAGGVFVDPPSLARDFARVHACERQEESGPWLFERFVRAR
jgi:riboflavin biosynthesis pyrimidine reductase